MKTIKIILYTFFFYSKSFIMYVIFIISYFSVRSYFLNQFVLSFFF